MGLRVSGHEQGDLPSYLSSTLSRSPRRVVQTRQRFTFWGRVSTEDQQDCDSSRAWRVSRTRALIEPRGGEIVNAI